MSIISTKIGEAVSAVAENAPKFETPQNVPAVGNIVQQGQEAAKVVLGFTTEVVNGVLTGSPNLTAGGLETAEKFLGLIKKGATDVLGGLLNDVDQRINLTAKLSIEPEALLGALATAMASAADLVTASRSTDLLLTDGKILTEFYVKLPPPANVTGAYARVELNLKSKEYMRLTTGTNP